MIVAVMKVYNSPSSYFVQAWHFTETLGPDLDRRVDEAIEHVFNDHIEVWNASPSQRVTVDVCEPVTEKVLRTRIYYFAHGQWVPYDKVLTGA